MHTNAIIDTFPKLKVTPARIARHQASTLDIARGIQRGWESAGEDIHSDEGAAAFQAVMASLLVPEREEWMSPDMALAVIASHISDEPLPPDRALDMRDAMRTHGSMTQEEKAEACGRVMGTTAGHIAATYGKSDGGPVGRTALYRHYDDRGVLLYVGIAHNPNDRAESHRRSSRWAKFSVEMSVEWLDTRPDALAAESSAIHAERPVFNVSGSSREVREMALEYLFDRLDR